MTNLPWMKAIYNLGDLLRRPGRGEPIPVLVARDQVVRQLMEEYRKAAEQALKIGDFRRAAYIYGVLLQDDRTAANALCARACTTMRRSSSSTSSRTGARRPGHLRPAASLTEGLSFIASLASTSRPATCCAGLEKKNLR